MMCRTMLRGAVCHRTSTPHKSGNKMKEKKKKKNCSVGQLTSDTALHDYFRSTTLL